jgi:hypothetical protein
MFFFNLRYLKDISDNLINDVSQNYARNELDQKRDYLRETHPCKSRSA